MGQKVINPVSKTRQMSNQISYLEQHLIYANDYVAQLEKYIKIKEGSLDNFIAWEEENYVNTNEEDSPTGHRDTGGDCWGGDSTRTGTDD